MSEASYRDEERNAEIIRLWKMGWMQIELAKKYDLTAVRIGEIIKQEDKDMQQIAAPEGAVAATKLSAFNTYRYFPQMDSHNYLGTVDARDTSDALSRALDKWPEQRDPSQPQDGFSVSKRA